MRLGKLGWERCDWENLASGAASGGEASLSSLPVHRTVLHLSLLCSALSNCCRSLLLTPRSGGVEQERVLSTHLRSDGRIDIGSLDGSLIERSKGVKRYV